MNEREICFSSDDPWYRGEAETYLLEIGLSADEIAQIRTRLGE